MQHAASSYHSLQSFDLSTLASFFHTHTHTHTQRASELTRGASALPPAISAGNGAFALTTAPAAVHGHSGCHRPFRLDTALQRCHGASALNSGASRLPFYHLWHLPFGRRWWFSLLDLRSGRAAVSPLLISTISTVSNISVGHVTTDFDLLQLTVYMSACHGRKGYRAPHLW